jgi:hypothetical protein
MHKDYALFNLAEAKAAIETLISEMQADPEYDVGNYIVDMQHIYWHINSAWNGRNFDVSRDQLTDEKFEAFIDYPKDLAL